MVRSENNLTVTGKQNTDNVALYLHTTYDSNSFRHIFHIMSYGTCVAGVFSLLEELFTWDTIELWVEISQRTLEYTLFDGTIDVILPLVESIHFFKTCLHQTSK